MFFSRTTSQRLVAEGSEVLVPAGGADLGFLDLQFIGLGEVFVEMQYMILTHKGVH